VNTDDSKRADMLNRLIGGKRLRGAARVGAHMVADAFVAFEAVFRKNFGGDAQFTGNNRVFANGAVAYQVRCAQCRDTFWVTALPYAFCPDCDRLSFYR
jgi:hypothetical protein